MPDTLCPPSQTPWDRATSNAAQAWNHLDQAGNHVASAIGALAEHACSDLGQKADDLAALAGSRVKDYGASLARQTSPDGLVGCVSESLAQTIEGSGKYLQSAKLRGMAADISVIVKRNPLASLATAACLGWLLARAARR